MTKASNEKQLVQIFKQLNEVDQSSILSFAEFLISKSGLGSELNNETKILENPVDIKRPEDEKVVIAIKRLSKTYPMIKKSSVFDKAAKLMTDHMLHGKNAVLVIDELELLFDGHYKQYVASFSVIEEQ